MLAVNVASRLVKRFKKKKLQRYGKILTTAFAL
jgi:hypothetical protein